MKIDLRKVFVENITCFWKNKIIFGRERLRGTLKCAHAYMCMRTQTHSMPTHVYGMHTYVRAPETM